MGNPRESTMMEGVMDPNMTGISAINPSQTIIEEEEIEEMVPRRDIKNKTFPRASMGNAYDYMYNQGMSYAGMPTGYEPDPDDTFYKKVVKKKTITKQDASMQTGFRQRKAFLDDSQANRTFPMRSTVGHAEKLCGSFGGNNVTNSLCESLNSAGGRTQKSLIARPDFSGGPTPECCKTYPPARAGHEYDYLYDKGLSYGGHPGDWEGTPDVSFSKAIRKGRASSPGPAPYMDSVVYGNTFPGAAQPGDAMGYLYEGGMSYGGYPAAYQPDKSDTFHRQYNIGKGETSGTPSCCLTKASRPARAVASKTLPREQAAYLSYGVLPEDYDTPSQKPGVSSTKGVVFDPNVYNKTFPGAAEPGDAMGYLYDSGMSYGGYPAGYKPDQDDTFHRKYMKKPAATSTETPVTRKITKKTKKITTPVSASYASESPQPSPEPVITKEMEYQERFVPVHFSTPNPQNVWVPDYNKPDRQMEQVLESLEDAETSRIHQDLKDFQVARRRLIFDATNINAT